MDHRITKKKNIFTRRLSGNEIALGFLLLTPAFFLANIYIASAITKFIYLTFNLEADYTAVNIMVNLVDDLIMVFICFIALKPLLKKAFDSFKEDPIPLLLKGIVLGFLVCLLASYVGNIVLRLFTPNTTSVNQSSIESYTKINPGIMIFMTVVLAPLGEELFFRGFIFTFVRKYNRILAYFVSAFLFGFVHVMNTVLAGNLSEMIQMIPYFTMGIAFCFMYEYTNNIFGSILAHATQNAVAMMAILSVMHLL